MDLNQIGDYWTRSMLRNRILSIVTLSYTNVDKTIGITTAIQRIQGGLPLADATTGAKVPTAGNTMAAQAANTTAYYVVTLVNNATAALKIYKCADGEDKWCWEDLIAAFEDDEMPVGAFKAVTTAAWTCLTDNWDDADVTVTTCPLAGFIPVVKPSELTFGVAVL